MIIYLLNKKINNYLLNRAISSETVFATEPHTELQHYSFQNIQSLSIYMTAKELSSACNKIIYEICVWPEGF